MILKREFKKYRAITKIHELQKAEPYQKREQGHPLLKSLHFSLKKAV